MPTSSEIIQRRSLFAAQGTRRYKRSGCIGFGDRFTSESVIGIPRIAHFSPVFGKEIYQKYTVRAFADIHQ